MNRPGLRIAVAAWLEARLYVTAAFVVTDAIIDRLEPPPDFTPLSDGLLAWDGSWYHRIAEQGYLDATDPATRFFPLFPLLGRWLGAVLGNSEIALIAIANIASLLAAVWLHRITLDETGDPRTADRAVRLLALFPPAFVLVLAYSESLFLVLALGALLAARRGRWHGAAVGAYLAGLTRPVGTLLALPLLVRLSIDKATRNPRAWLAVAAAPLGSATFLAWAAVALDDWRAPLDRQQDLRGGVAEPLTRLLSALVDGLRGDEGELFHFGAAAAVIVLAITACRQLSPDLWSYAVASGVVLIAAENLNSMERYTLTAFPLLIAAAILSRHPALDRWLPTASAVGMVAVTTLALNGVYVP